MVHIAAHSENRSAGVHSVFIVGRPRSGTTLRAGFLTGTPWAVPVESHFIPKYFKKLKAFGDLRQRSNFKRLFCQILAERPIRQWGLTESADAVYESMNSYTYRDVVEAIFELRSRRGQLASWGDKTPHYILDIELIHRLFPRAKIVHIVRDGRDVALSLMGRPWGPANVYGAAVYWKRCHSPRPIFAKLAARGLLHTVRYEDILECP